MYAPYNSSSPEEVARLIVRPLEDALSTINGVKRLSARASANDASIDLEFNEGVDMDLAAVEVRDRVDRVRNDLPDDLERVFIRRFQSSDIPVLRMNLSAPWEGERLFEFIEDVMRRRLERLEGVANVEVWGLLTPQLRVDLLPQRMAAHGVDVRTVILALQNGNVSLAGGYVREGSRKLLVRVMGELDSVEQIKRLPLGRGGIRIEDVADVVYDLPERYEFNWLNGEQSVGMAINKASNANLLAVVEGVKKELAAIQRLPEAEGLTVQIPWDSSNDVKKGLSELYKSGAIGGLLAVVFMLFFLKRFRMTLLIALAIPLSLVLTFVIMYFYRLAKLGDISINIMSLMGLMLSVGMLVDNSIVVIEAIVRRRQTLGEDAKTATLRGASEVAMPIICSTMTNVCVFVPMVFLKSAGGGMFTGFMKNLGLTIVIVMVASLLVSLTVVPMAASILLRDSKDRRHPIFDRVNALYGRTLQFTLHHRMVFAVLIVFLLWVSIRLFMGDRALVRDHFVRAPDRGPGRDAAQLLARREARAVRASLRPLRLASRGARDRRRQLPLPALERPAAVAVRRQQPDRDLPGARKSSRSSRRSRSATRSSRCSRWSPGSSIKIGRNMRGPPGSDAGVAGRADRGRPRDPRHPERAGDGASSSRCRS